MTGWGIVFILTFGTGLSMVIGALLGMIEHLGSRWLETELRHSVIAFGGGILVAAIALVLVHEGIKNLSFPYMILCFGAGGLFFMIFDRWLNKKKDSAPQLVAMLLDFIPEALALGALFVYDRNYAYLLAIIIALQNIPEGFNAFHELRVISRYPKSKILLTFFWMSFLGPVAGLSGFFFLSEFHEIISGVMLFASGGILYLVFQDIAPQAKLKHHWAPSLGAVAGFLCGMIGKKFVS